MHARTELLAAVLCGAAAVLAPLCSAAEPRKSGQFYEQDFPKNILQNKPPLGATATPTPAGAASSENVQPGPHSETFITEPEESPSPSPSPTPAPEDMREKLDAVDVRRLGAVLNVNDEKHALENLAQLVDVAVRHNLRLGKIYCVGVLPARPQLGLLAGVGLQGGRFESSSAPPAKYPVKKSPAWIVESVKGDIILEGFPSLDRFINSKGQFVANTGME